MCQTENRAPGTVAIWSVGNDANARLVASSEFYMRTSKDSASIFDIGILNNFPMMNPKRNPKKLLRTITKKIVRPLSKIWFLLCATTVPITIQIAIVERARRYFKTFVIKDLKK